MNTGMRNAMAGKPNYEDGKAGISVQVIVPVKALGRVKALDEAAQRLRSSIKAWGLVFNACHLHLARFAQEDGFIACRYAGYEDPDERKAWLRRAQMKGEE